MLGKNVRTGSGHARHGRAPFQVEGSSEVDKPEWKKGYWMEPSWCKGPVEPGNINEITRKCRVQMGMWWNGPALKAKRTLTFGCNAFITCKVLQPWKTTLQNPKNDNAKRYHARLIGDLPVGLQWNLQIHIPRADPGSRRSGHHCEAAVRPRCGG